jgi:hypothetical protein
MSASRKAGKRDTGTRHKILDACAAIMSMRDMPRPTSRRVVYSCFPTMDDLHLAVLKRGSQTSLRAQRRALSPISRYTHCGT